AVHAHASPAPAPGAAPFVVHVARELVANRYEALWAELHPAQRSVLPRDAYVRCESLTPVPGRLASIRVLSVRAEPAAVPGLARPVPSTAVRIRLVVAVGGGRGTVVHTIHALRAPGRWTWFLAAPRYDAYLAGGCPGTAPPPPAGPAI
ncbi:MAG: hypothetical protein ACXVZL_04315, partial [Gaiellaceae bacterium]